MIVGLVVLGAACSADEASEPTASVASVVIDPDTGVIQPLIETGTMTITVVAADGTSPITVADRLDQVLRVYPGAKRASVEGSVVTAVATEFPRDEVLSFDFTMRPEPVVSLHPVLFCPDTDEAAGTDDALHRYVDQRTSRRASRGGPCRLMSVEEAVFEFSTICHARICAGHAGREA